MEKEASPRNELQSLEGGLRVLWEQVRLAGESIVRLRGEKSTLQSRVTELEAQLRASERALAVEREELKKLEAGRIEREAQGNTLFSDGERDALAAKVKDLLARIDAYL